MTNNHKQDTETVASAQPFLNAEKEQLESLKKTGQNAQDVKGEVGAEFEQLTQAAKELGNVTAQRTMSASEAATVLSDEVVLSPEIQAKLDKLAEIEAAEKAEQEEVEETKVAQDETGVAGVSPEIQAKLDKLAEIEAAEKVEQEGLEKDPDYVKFAKPYFFEGKEYKGIKMEFDDMTGADILEAEEEFIAIKTQTAAQTPLKELSKGYLSFFAARACGQPVDFILGLDGKTFAKITRKAQSFLLAED